MEKEKIVNKIVDDIMVEVIEKELPQKYILSSNNLNGDVQQYNNREKIIDTTSKKIEKEKNDLVKKFIGKKERKSKVIINNDNVGLFLEQERNGDSE